MKILLAFNDNYAPHATTVMESIIRNTNTKVNFVIMYFQDELSSSIIEKIKSHFIQRVEGLEFVSVEKSYAELFENVEYSQHLTINTFLRLLAPHVLKDEAVLYLDCDLIVLDDISVLMDQANLDFSINAVPEHYPSSRIKLLERKKKKTFLEYQSLKQEELQFAKKRYLKMQIDSSYFNAGVMVMNLKKWRAEELFGKILEFLESHTQLHSGDQDALNGVVNGNYCMLPLSWNVHPYIYNLNEYTSNYLPNELEKAKNNPSIIHFAGYKAWEYRYENKKYKELYWKYRSYTPWPEKKENGKTLHEIIKKKIIIPIRLFMIKVVGWENVNRFKMRIYGK